LYDLVVNKREEFLPALVSVLAQLTYTSLFGALESEIFMRTGRLSAAVAAHAFCNFMGFPRVDLLVSKEISFEKRALAGAAYVVGATAFVFAGFAWCTSGFDSEPALLLVKNVIDER
jgi:prenyl protein peptidase